MIAPCSFLAMRADLVERGLLILRPAQDGREVFRLTEAGVAHAEALVEELQGAEAPAEPWKPRVRWNVDLRRRARA